MVFCYQAAAVLFGSFTCYMLHMTRLESCSSSSASFSLNWPLDLVVISTNHGAGYEGPHVPEALVALVLHLCAL